MADYPSEQEAVNNYDSSQYITPDGYTSDIAVFTITAEEYIKNPKVSTSKELKIMLIKRAAVDAAGRPNIEGGKWALPGGFIDGRTKETALEAAARELEEETGISGIFLKHFGVYDEFGRDKRGWIIANAHYAIVPEQALSKRKAADDAVEVQLFSIDEVFSLNLAFDHRKIIKDAISFIERDLIETKVAKNFLPEEFTLSELQSVLLTVSNNPRITTKSVFFAKVPKLAFIEKVYDEDGNPKKTERNSYRPSQLYRFNDVEVIKSIYE
ncbi:NUDIX domain-containing protein [Ornithinibacillus scapharcae]|uniref:NUDIX domain-containing protein n=1 Tax=Ornithinibacillus scapharcae TaxID=1147159 RepID=UPI000225BBD5|nr:NUDIX domain-containing protein [Ornithinibacillus scapharcae]